MLNLCISIQSTWFLYTVFIISTMFLERLTLSYSTKQWCSLMNSNIISLSRSKSCVTSPMSNNLLPFRFGTEFDIRAARYVCFLYQFLDTEMQERKYFINAGSSDALS